MSYILDALKKSEQERKKGSVPGLGTIQGLPGGGRPNDNWPLRYYFGVTLVLLVVTVTLSWVFFREPRPSQTKVVVPAPAASPLASQGASPAPTAAPAAKPTGRSEKSRRAEKSLPPPADHQQPSRKLPPPPPFVAALQAPAPATVPAPPPPSKPSIKGVEPTKSAASSPFLPPLEKSSTTPTLPVEEEAVVVTPPGDTPGEEAEAVVKPEDMPIVPQAELPDDLKSAMPEIKIGIHFYSDDPSSRRAGVNGRLLHEGQQVEKDLILKEITRDGAIFAFRGRRFSLPVFPR